MIPLPRPVLPPEAVIVWAGGDGLTSYRGCSVLATVPRRRARAVNVGPTAPGVFEEPEPVIVPPTPVRVVVRRECACGCGESFVPNRRDQRYLNNKHRLRVCQRRWVARHPESARIRQARCRERQAALRAQVAALLEVRAKV